MKNRSTLSLVLGILVFVIFLLFISFFFAAAEKTAIKLRKLIEEKEKELQLLFEALKEKQLLKNNWTISPKGYFSL